MKVLAFQAHDAAAALARVNAELGPEAVVVSVRRLPPGGWSRLWRRHGKIEVTACVPAAPDQEPAPDPAPPAGQISTPRRRPEPPIRLPAASGPLANPRWRTLQWLESKGLLPAFVEQLERKVQLLHGEQPPATPEQEWAAVTDLIVCHWRAARNTSPGTGRPHVFIGPPGSGKSTALCKWMVHSVLVHERSVHVWRLDGATANASEILQLHCESLGVPTARFWRAPLPAADLLLVDLPGVEAQDPAALKQLQNQLAGFPRPHLHLVLNATLETSILMTQFQAFEPLHLDDIIFTHLDEELQRVKLWNFVLGTDCPISFLGTGQKIPGEFLPAEPALLFPQKNRRQT